MDPAFKDVMGMESPGGFVFGLQGWIAGAPKPTSITFFLDNTAKVSDTFGRPIKGAMVDNKKVIFAPGPPGNDDPPGMRSDGRGGYITGFATHAQVIAALEAEHVDWKSLACAGWPQLTYAELKKLPAKLLPPMLVGPDGQDDYRIELRKIHNQELRRDAMRFRREVFEAHSSELDAAEEDD